MNPVLLELQDVDSALLRVAREKARLDDGTTAREKRDALESELSQERAKLLEATTDRSRKEDELQATEDKIARQNKRLMNVSSAHEVSALQRDIEGLGRARGDLDEAILMRMDEIETLEGRVKGLERQAAQAREQAAQIESDFARQTAQLNAQATEQRAKRPGVEAKLSDKEKDKYAQLAKKHAGVAVARAVAKGGEKSCSACGTQILPFTLREAKEQEFPTCESCGRLIWVD